MLAMRPAEDPGLLLPAVDGRADVAIFFPTAAECAAAAAAAAPAAAPALAWRFCVFFAMVIVPVGAELERSSEGAVLGTPILSHSR